MKSCLNAGASRKRRVKIVLIVTLVIGVTLLHYASDKQRYYDLVFFGELYFLPIVLAGFWFGLSGAVATSLSITACYSPFIFIYWQGFSPVDFDRILSVILYNSSGVLIGILKQRERAAQQRLLQDEGLVAIGKSLAAVAHDMKSPLIAIGGLTRQALKKLEKNNPARERLVLALKETVRLEAMMRDMLDFSKPYEVKRSPGNLNALVEDSMAIVGETARSRAVTVECMLSDSLPPVAFDAVRIKQVIVNLAVNAVESSPEGNVVTVRTFSDDHQVVLEVIDCGPGIAHDHRKRVFDPFFSTKKAGTGLGLAIVKKIVSEHNGGVEIADNLSGGTIFRVMLPRR